MRPRPSRRKAAALRLDAILKEARAIEQAARALSRRYADAGVPADDEAGVADDPWPDEDDDLHDADWRDDDCGDGPSA